LEQYKLEKRQKQKNILKIKISMEKEELKNDPEEYKLIQKNIRKMYK